MRDTRSERIHRHELKRAKRRAQTRYVTFCKTHGGLAARQAENAKSKPGTPKGPRIIPKKRSVKRITEIITPDTDRRQVDPPPHVVGMAVTEKRSDAAEVNDGNA